MKVFLSYSDSDKELASDLARGLSKRGHKVWFADHSLLPGDNWSLEVGKALENSEAMVVVLSQTSTESQSQSREVQYALASPHFRDRVVSVLVPPTDKVPSRRFPWILDKLTVIEASGSSADTSKRIDRALMEKKHQTVSR